MVAAGYGEPARTDEDGGQRDAVAGWWPIVAVALAVFVLLLDATAVSVALPAMQRDLGASLAQLQWVIDGYVLTLAAFQLIGGSGGDRFGHRNVLITGVVVFAMSSCVCGLAPNAATLIGASAVQGVGGALMFSTTLALIARYYRGSARGTAFAVRGTVAGLAAAAGPLVGGAITTGLGWRWIYFANLPVAVVTASVAAATLRREAPLRRDRRLDTGGTLTFTASVLLLVVALLRGNTLGWDSAGVVGPLVAAAAMATAFVAIETRHPDPMLDIALFRRRRFTGAQIAALTAQGTVLPLIVYLSLYFQGPLGATAWQTGTYFLPFTLPILLVGAATGSLMDKVALHRLIATGLAVMGVGLLLMHGLDPQSSWTSLLAGFVVAGVGVGLTLPPVGNIAVAVVEPHQVGMGSGVGNTVQQLGFAIGVAVYGAIFSHHVGAALAGGATPATAYGGGLDPLFVIAGCVAGVGAALVLVLNRTNPAPRPGHDAGDDA